MAKLIVITGGSKGIGRALIRRFMQLDFDVITCGRDENAFNEMKKDLIAEGFNNQLLFSQTDVSKKKECLEFIEFIKGFKRNVDVLVNNAGLFQPGSIESEEDGTLEYLLDTNVKSAYYITRGLLPGFRENQTGHIFNMCSTASIIPYTNGGSYCISKFALLGFSKVLREEMKEEGVRVTSILPGATYTSSWEGVEIPEERFMKAEDVADIVASIYQLSKATVVEDILLRPQLGDL